MSHSSSRRNFLRGRFHRPQPNDAPLRPPVISSEEAFIERCSRCNDCVTACPQKIVITDPKGFPVIDFSVAECTFCNACNQACTTGALHPITEDSQWRYRAWISATCLAYKNVECRSCGDFCPINAIHFYPRPGNIALPKLEQEFCNGCGACIAPCPVQAITVR